ncbi:MAG: hypothetical protein ACWA5R_03535 [bacterium]
MPIKKTNAIFSFLILYGTANANSWLEPSCRKSFNIEPTRIIELDNQSMSCKYLEESKNNIYESFDHSNYDYIMGNIQQTERELEKLEARLRDTTYTSEHSNMALATLGQTTAALGLASCIPTLGTGCGLAIVSAGGATISKFTAIKSYSDKANYISEIRSDLADAQQKLKRHSEQLPDAWERATKNFNQTCEIIETHCLK